MKMYNSIFDFAGRVTKNQLFSNSEDWFNDSGHGIFQALRSKMQNCVRFKLDDIDGMYGLMGKNLSSHFLYDGKLSVTNNIPYPSMWLEYTIWNQWRFNMIEFVDDKDSDFFRMYNTLGYSDNKGKSWGILPGIVLVTVDNLPPYRTGIDVVDVNGTPLDNLGASVERLDEMVHDVNTELGISNIFLKILQCKNIGVVDVAPSKSQQKRQRRKKKKPFLSHKVLVINPSEKRKGGINKPHQGGSNRVHICRGHFKSYTEDNPLFGKYVGDYWWQPSVRGNKGKGKVVKDYEVRV